MLPVLLATVTMPSETFHLAGWARSWAETHSSRFFPSKRTIASEGGLPHSTAGVTTLGSGVQTSVSSGLGCWEWSLAAMVRTQAIVRNLETRVRIMPRGYNETVVFAAASLFAT